MVESRLHDISYKSILCAVDLSDETEAVVRARPSCFPGVVGARESCTSLRRRLTLADERIELTA
jgi:hypothetical protein